MRGDDSSIVRLGTQAPREIPLAELQEKFTRDQAIEALEGLLGPGCLERQNLLRVALFLDALRGGETRWNACKRSGMRYTEILDWMDMYPEFKMAVDFCEADAEATAVNAIRSAIKGGELVRKTTTTERRGSKVKTKEVEERTPPDWRAAAHYLERRNPDIWGERKRIDVHSLTDKQIIAILTAEIGAGSLEEGPPSTNEGSAPEHGEPA